MTPLVEASVVLCAGAGAGLAGAVLYRLAQRAASAGTPPAVVGRRAFSYAALALVLLAGAWTGVPGVALLVGLLAAAGLLEWSRLFDLPAHHRVGLLAADAVIVATVALRGVDGAPALVGSSCWWVRSGR